jgi:hypothetical protein
MHANWKPAPRIVAAKEVTDFGLPSRKKRQR